MVVSSKPASSSQHLPAGFSFMLVTSLARLAPGRIFSWLTRMRALQCSKFTHGFYDAVPDYKTLLDKYKILYGENLSPR